MARILVLSPHPDDESLGCGGTLRKHIVEGDAVQVIFLTSGEMGGHGMPPSETKRVRETEAKEAAAVLGYCDTEFWRVPNGRLRATRRIIGQLQSKIQEWEPDVIYVTHDREMHPEHRAAAKIVRHAMKGGFTLKKIPDVLMYEVWTPLQEMDHIVDISDYVEIKRQAIRSHKSQCAVMKFDDAMLGLNRYRGEMHSWPGGEYAEIFVRMTSKDK